MGRSAFRTNIVKRTASVVGVQGPALRFVLEHIRQAGASGERQQQHAAGTGPIPDAQMPMSRTC